MVAEALTRRHGERASEDPRKKMLGENCGMAISLVTIFGAPEVVFSATA